MGQVTNPQDFADLVAKKLADLMFSATALESTLQAVSSVLCQQSCERTDAVLRVIGQIEADFSRAKPGLAADLDAFVQMAGLELSLATQLDSRTSATLAIPDPQGSAPRASRAAISTAPTAGSWGYPTRAGN